MNNFYIHFQFFRFLISHGSFKSRNLNYEQTRLDVLKGLPLDRPTEHVLKKSPYIKLRSAIIRISIVRPIIANLAFILNHKKIYRKLFIWEGEKLIYLRIFKCGSTSILRSLLPAINNSLKGHSITDTQIDAIAHYLEKHRASHPIERYKVFTVTRNPLERIVSGYLDIFKDGNYDDFLFCIFKKNMTFKETLEVIEKIPDYLRGPHFTSQHYIIKTITAGGVMQFKLGSENGKLQEFLAGFSLRLNHSNKSLTPYDYRDYYDLEILELVYRIYKNDFIQLGFLDAYEEVKTYLNRKV